LWRVVDNLVLEHVADVTLRSGGSDEALGSELRHNAIDILSSAGDFLGHIRTCPGENAFNSGWVANQYDGFSVTVASLRSSSSSTAELGGAEIRAEEWRRLPSWKCDPVWRAGPPLSGE